jgi:hypothetical protein
MCHQLESIWYRSYNDIFQQGIWLVTTGGVGQTSSQTDRRQTRRKHSDDDKDSSGVALMAD